MATDSRVAVTSVLVTGLYMVPSVKVISPPLSATIFGLETKRQVLVSAKHEAFSILERPFAF